VVKRSYVPDAGDLIWMTFDPQTGHEQRGRRPALVLSPRLYNGKTGLALACRVTSRVKGYPFEVLLPETGTITGVVLSDQVRNLDWQARRAVFGDRVSPEILTDVRERLRTVIGL
jgi:mRNA interferase MazF